MNPSIGKRKPNAYQWTMYLSSRTWRRYAVEGVREHEGWYVIDRGVARLGAVRHVTRVGEALPTQAAAQARARELNGITS